MSIIVPLQATDLENLRFAYSPLIEATISYALLQKPEHQGAYRLWAGEARSAIHGMQFPYMDAMIQPHKYVADFITPTPLAPEGDFERALVSLREMPPEIIRESAQDMMRMHGETEIRWQFLTYPHEAVECLIEEMRLYWQMTLAHHWGRIRTILDNDILFQAREGALRGVDQMLSQLTPTLRYASGALEIVKDRPRCDDMTTSDGKGIQFVPAVFLVCDVMWMFAPHWRPLIIYGARGAGLWYKREQQEPEQALRAAFGDSRAVLLAALQTPGHTSELALRLGVTSGAISQQLSKLDEAGLVDSHRDGYRVYYRLSARGEKLMQLFTSN